MSDTPPPGTSGGAKEAKAAAKAAKAHAKAMRPWYKKKRFMIPIVLVVIMIAGVAASGGSDQGTDVASSSDSELEQTDSGGGSSSEVDAEGSEADDVAVETCQVGEFDMLEVTLNVTNNSSKRSAYFIDVSVEGEDGSQIESGFASVDNLEPGQSTVTDVALFGEDPGQGFTCRIVEVDRMSDE